MASEAMNQTASPVAAAPLSVAFIGFGEAGQTFARGLHEEGVRDIRLYDILFERGEDLRALPFPDYTIFDRGHGLAYLSPRAVQSPSLTTVPVLSGRGCPYRCSYCANTTLLDLHGIKSGFLRKFDPEALVEDLAVLGEESLEVAAEVNLLGRPERADRLLIQRPQVWVLDRKCCESVCRRNQDWVRHTLNYRNTFN